MEFSDSTVGYSRDPLIAITIKFKMTINKYPGEVFLSFTKKDFKRIDCIFKHDKNGRLFKLYHETVPSTKAISSGKNGTDYIFLLIAAI